MILAIIKFVDKSLSTLRTITLLKGQYLLSAILECISEIIFAYMVVGIVGNKNFSTVLMIAIAGGLGKYITCRLNDKYSKEKTYINVITGNTHSKTEIEKLYKLCRRNRIKCFLYDTYDYDMKPSLTIQIYAETKSDSKLVDKFIKECDYKLLRKII